MATYLCERVEMDKSVLAAISAAVNAYIEQEGQAKAVTSRAVPYAENRSRRPFGRQRVMGARARQRARGSSR
jgi:hypothetical protein